MEHKTYNKIQTLYKRNERGKIMLGDFSRPEFEYLYNVKWKAFEKIDGTNMSFYWDGHNMQIHGKSENASIPSSLLTVMEGLLNEDKLREVFPIKYDENGNEVPFIVRIYGEGYGVGIQKCGGSYIQKNNHFRVFDIKINEFWLEWDNVLGFASSCTVHQPYG